MVAQPPTRPLAPGRGIIGSNAGLAAARRHADRTPHASPSTPDPWTTPATTPPRPSRRSRRPNSTRWTRCCRPCRPTARCRSTAWTATSPRCSSARRRCWPPWPRRTGCRWVWGGDGEAGPAAAAPFASKRQRKTTVVMVLRHLRHLASNSPKRPTNGSPSSASPSRAPTSGPTRATGAPASCRRSTCSRRPGATPGTDPALAPLLVLGGGLEGVAPARRRGGQRDLDDPAVCDRLSRAVPEAVLHLRARRCAAGQPGARHVR